MAEQQVLDVQHGIWLDADWLEKAGLGSHIQVIVQPGEIRILTAPPESEPPKESEDGWDVFLSLEAGALPGKLHNASTNHDRYLYATDS
jgi:hypothetical protein